MTGVETRSLSRDSLLLFAAVRVEQAEDHHRVKVRNLSDGGMMGEGALRVQRGNRVEVELRNIGRVNGSIAWVQDDRFGIAFDEEIDAQMTRQPQKSAGIDDEVLNSMSRAHRAPPPPTDPKNLRKI